MASVNRGFKGVWIPKEIWLDENLTLQEKVLYAEIDSLDNDDGCYAGNAHFSRFLGVSKDRVSKLISSLRNKGYITVEMVYKDGTKEIDKRIIKCNYTYRRKDQYPIGENTDTPIGENAKENNTLFNNTIYISIFEYWNSKGIIKHRQLTNKMKTKIRTTLKDYTEDEIKRIMDNYAEIIHDDKYWFNYKWTLVDFLQRGLDKFEDLEVAKENYIKDKRKNEVNSADYDPYSYMEVQE
jgi:DNA-binding transcriptional ArsR family regulator